MSSVHVALVVVQILFASLAIAGRFVLREFPAGGLVLVRIAGAAVVLLAANALLHGDRVRGRRDLGRLALLGLLGIAANQGLFVYGLQYTTAINATILVTTVPVFTVLGSLLVGLEPASAGKLGGIALAGAGAVWLIGPDRLSLTPDVAIGNAMIVAGMVCYAAYFILSKPILRRYRPLTVSAYAMGFGALGVAPFGIPSIVSLDPSAISGATWLWVAYIVVFPTIVTYLLNIWALKRVSSNVVAVFIYLQPLVTALAAPLILSGERVTPRAAAAGLAIFAGLALVIRAERRQHREVPIDAPAGE